MSGIWVLLPYNCDDSNMHSANIGAYLYKSFGHESVVSLSFNKNWNVNSSLAKYFDYTYAPRTSLKLRTHLGQTFYQIIFDFFIIKTNFTSSVVLENWYLQEAWSKKEKKIVKLHVKYDFIKNLTPSCGSLQWKCQHFKIMPSLFFLIPR